MERPLSSEAHSLPGLLSLVHESYRNPRALVHRDGGYWRPIANEEFVLLVRRLALGFQALGLRPGQTVGVMARSSPFWMAIDLAAMAAGGITVPLFANAAETTIRHIAEHADLRWCFVDGETTWEPSASLRDRCRHVVVRGVPPGGKALDYRRLAEQGDAAAAADPRAFARLLAARDRDDVATVIYTSGSTGVPKGVELTHGNLLSQVHAGRECFPLDPSADVALSALPLAHVFERMVSLVYLSSGLPLVFADDLKRLGEILGEIRPTVFTAVPRLLEKMHDRIMADADSERWPSNRIARWAFERAHDPARGWRHRLADAAVYRHVRAALGDRVRLVIVGGAALPAHIESFFAAVGIPLYPGYGLTEAGPVVSTNRPGAARQGTVGRAFPGVEVRIAENEEILARGPGIMRGYRGDPEATAAAVDADGWLHTGDRGRLDEDGYLTIVGRLKELLKTAGGKYVSPLPIEERLRAAALVDTAVVIAEGRPCVAALLFADPEQVRARKASAGMEDVDDDAFLADPAVTAEIARLVEEVNAKLDRWQRVRHWRFIPEPLTVDAGLLTPTLKVRRTAIEERFAAEIDAMYAEEDA